MRMVPANHNGSSNGHERARRERTHREQLRRLDELMREQMWDDLRILDPRTTAFWTVATLLGIAGWLTVIWFGIRLLS